jgi:PAS domain S-box-containing protein
LEVHPPDRREEVWAIIKEIIEGKKYSCPIPLITKDGKLIQVDTRITKAKWGKKDILFGICRDITELKVAEEKLRESEEMFRTITEQSLMGILIIQDNKIIYANEALSKINGYSIQEIFNWTLEEFLNGAHPDDRKLAIEYTKKRQLGDLDLPPFYSWRIITKSGEQKWIDSYGKVIKFKGKYADLAVITDASERMKALEELRESEEKFRRIAEQNLMGIVILQDDKIKYVNQAVADITGNSVEEMMSWDPKDLYIKNIYREDLPLVIEQAGKKQRGETEGVIPHLSYRILSKSGEIKWIDQYSRTIIYEDKPADFITFIDITSRKEAEQKLRESEAQYREAYNRAEFYKDLFAHDMNNILQGILSANQLINMMQNKPEKQQQIDDLINTISQQVDRGSKLVANVRKLSQLEERKLPIEKIEFLNILNESIKRLKNSYQDRTIDIRIDSSSEKIFAKANILIEDVFENILINAVKHNKSPAVEIIVKISNLEENGVNYLKMEFIDNGIGVEEHRKANIFQRDQKDTQSVSGMGLGLSIVKKIIDSYDGRIWVEERVKGNHSKGSNFVVLIPEGD